MALIRLMDSGALGLWGPPGRTSELIIPHWVRTGAVTSAETTVLITWIMAGLSLDLCVSQLTVLLVKEQNEPDGKEWTEDVFFFFEFSFSCSRTQIEKLSSWKKSLHEMHICARAATFIRLDSTSDLRISVSNTQITMNRKMQKCWFSKI